MADKKYKLRILPDETLWITEVGGYENNVASWNPPRRPDRTEKSWVGGYVKGEKVSDNVVDWLNKVAKEYDLEKEYVVAESWVGGGMRHKDNPFTFVKNMRKVSGQVEKSDPKYGYKKSTPEKKETNILNLAEWMDANNIKEPNPPQTQFGKGSWSDNPALVTRYRSSLKKWRDDKYPEYIAYVKTEIKKGNDFQYKHELENYANFAVNNGEPIENIKKLLQSKNYKLVDGKWKSPEQEVKYTIIELKTIHESRSPQSKAMDEIQSHQVTLEPDSPKVARWVRDQGYADVKGIDTPSRKKKRPVKKAKRKVKPTSLKGVK